jgi:hypothetical protein
LLRCSGAVRIYIRAKVFDKKKTTKTTSIEGGEVRMSPGQRASKVQGLGFDRRGGGEREGGWRAKWG